MRIDCYVSAMNTEIALLFPVALSILTLWAMATDAYAYRIPNMVNLAIILLFPIALFATDAPLNWQNALLGFALVFAVGFVLFVANIMGGGDVKMLAAISLWLEYGRILLDFFLLMSILGGILTLFLLSSRKYAPFIALKMRKNHIPKLFTHGEPVPYGIAIGIAFLWLLWAGKLAIYVNI